MRIESTRPLLLKFTAPPTEAGEFSGIAATWQRDRDGDRFDPGAFDATLSEWSERGALPPVLWNHHNDDPLGVLTSATPTDKGLEISGRIVPTTPSGGRALALLKAGPGALALSVGALVREQADEPDGALILSVDLLEVSLTPTPAQPGAIVYATRKELEHAARDGLGLSANQARRLAAGGFAALTRNDSGDDEETDRAHAALSRLLNLRN